jgi:transcriptional regulator with XRE-family HTH domain
MDRSTDPVSPRELFPSASRLAQQVGRRIKEARLEQGLSRRDFGAKLGISPQQIHKYETGKDAVPLYRLLTLASICGVSPQALWGQSDSAQVSPVALGAPDANILQLVRAYRRIGDAKVRKRLLQLVKQMAGEDDGSPVS